MMALMIPKSRGTARAAASLLLLSLVPACSRVFTTSGLRFQSQTRQASLSPAIVSAGYRAPDNSTAEFYFSDIPLRELSAAESFDNLAGTIVHVHLFIRPKPGKTPIEPTASSATVEAVVISRGEIGLYGGGGFMLPSGTPGDHSLGGSITGGSVRMLASTPGFVDRLGPAGVSAGLSAPRDEAAAGVMAHLFGLAREVATEQAPPAP